MISLISAVDIVIENLKDGIFALLDNVNSEKEDNIDELLNYSGTKFYAEIETYDVSTSTGKQI